MSMPQWLTSMKFPAAFLHITLTQALHMPPILWQCSDHWLLQSLALSTCYILVLPCTLTLQLSCSSVRSPCKLPCQMVATSCRGWTLMVAQRGTQSAESCLLTKMGPSLPARKGLQPPTPLSPARHAWLVVVGNKWGLAMLVSIQHTSGVEPFQIKTAPSTGL